MPPSISSSRPRAAGDVRMGPLIRLPGTGSQRQRSASNPVPHSEKTPMTIKTMEDLFVETLKDIYYAENTS
jgi:hypothetical protein